MAARSMTGFGASRTSDPTYPFGVEVKTVNHRFCEVKFRAPRELAGLETRVIALVKKQLARGSVDVIVRRSGGAGQAPAVNIDRGLAEAWLAGIEQLAFSLEVPGKLTVQDLAGLEGLVTVDSAETDLDEVWTVLEPALLAALGRVKAMRAEEGARLEADVRSRLDAIAAGIEMIETDSPKLHAAWRERFEARIASLMEGHELDEARLASEVAHHAERADVAEELTRLASHITAMNETLASDDRIGRRLDFLVQELGREVNTIGSKCQAAEITAGVVDLKTEIERIREQVQNIE